MGEATCMIEGRPPNSGERLYIHPSLHWRFGDVGKFVRRDGNNAVLVRETGIGPLERAVSVKALSYEPHPETMALAEMSIAGFHHPRERDLQTWMMARRHVSREGWWSQPTDEDKPEPKCAPWGGHMRVKCDLQVGQMAYLHPFYHDRYPPKGVVKGFSRGFVVLSHGDGGTSVHPFGTVSELPFRDHLALEEMLESGWVKPGGYDVRIWTQAKRLPDSEIARSHADLPHRTFLNV